MKQQHQKKPQQLQHQLLVRLLCKLVLIYILIISELLLRFWDNLLFDRVTGDDIRLTKG